MIVTVAETVVLEVVNDPNGRPIEYLLGADQSDMLTKQIRLALARVGK